MKKFSKFIRNKRIIKESVEAETKLLNNLFDYYSEKYNSISDIEDHFKKALGNLISNGDISLSSVDSFLKEQGIKPFESDESDDDMNQYGEEDEDSCSNRVDMPAGPNWSSCGNSNDHCR